MTNQFARCTEIIFATFNQEIYSYSGKDINNVLNDLFLILEEVIKGIFYHFLKQMLESFATEETSFTFNVDELNDPRNFKRIKEVATDIYSLEEYISCCKHTNRTAFHKGKLGQSLELLDLGLYKVQTFYDSYWL